MKSMTLQWLEFKKKEDKDKNHFAKLTGKSPNITDVINSRLKAINRSKECSMKAKSSSVLLHQERSCWSMNLLHQETILSYLKMVTKDSEKPIRLSGSQFSQFRWTTYSKIIPIGYISTISQPFKVCQKYKSSSPTNLTIVFHARSNGRSKNINCNLTRYDLH